MADSNWYDAEKLAAILRGQQPGADGRNLLRPENVSAVLQNLSGLQKSKEGVYNAANAGTYNPISGEWEGSTGSGGWEMQDGFVLGGQHFIPNGDGTYHTQYQLPGAESNADRAEVDYRIDENGNATPVGGTKSYNPSSWVATGRDFAKYAALAAAGGYAASLAAGGAATAPALTEGGAAAAGTSAESLALGDAAAGLIPAGEVPALTAAELAAAGAGSYPALSAEAAAAYAANAAAAGVPAAGSSLLDKLGNKIVDKLDNPQTYLDALKGYGGGTTSGGSQSGGDASGGGSSPGPFSFLPDRKAAIQAEALRAQKQAGQQSYMPTTIKV